MGRQRRKSKIQIEAPQIFQPGQIVRVSPSGVKYGLIRPGTTGKVITCSFLVTVQVDGFEERAYPPDFWEAEA